LDWYAPGLADEVHRADPDCVVCMGRMANSHLWWLGRSSQAIPLVATVRTGKWLSPFYRWSLNAATGVMVNSSYAQNRVVRETRVPVDRIARIRNPVLISNRDHPIHLMRSALRQKAGVRDRTLVLLSCAQFRPEKNLAGLAELAGHLPTDLDWQLWFVGTGTTEPKVREQVTELGLDERVHFWGYQKDPSPWINAADIAVRSSRSDSLPNFLIEAQWLGLPVVTTDVGGADECLLEGKSGWIVPQGDTQALRKAVVLLMSDPDLRKRASAAARAFARDAFEPNTQFQKQTDFLKNLAGI
jgi:glycosyltransferase involved in cell wall biosynthesis